uniref:Uncharacterized protein n=1 Tax=Arundo donax TaxID=35708 RepID=A0A0A9CB74_ARUDO
MSPPSMSPVSAMKGSGTASLTASAPTSCSPCFSSFNTGPSETFTKSPDAAASPSSNAPMMLLELWKLPFSEPSTPVPLPSAIASSNPLLVPASSTSKTLLALMKLSSGDPSTAPEFPLSGAAATPAVSSPGTELGSSDGGGGGGTLATLKKNPLDTSSTSSPSSP